MTIADAASAILLAATANLLTKMSAAVAMGGWRFGVPLVAVGVSAIAVAAGAWFLIGV